MINLAYLIIPFISSVTGEDSSMLIAQSDIPHKVDRKSLESHWQVLGESALPIVKRALKTDSLCGEAVEVLYYRYNYLDSDSLLKIISKVDCRDAKIKALDILWTGVFHYAWAEEKDWTEEQKEKIGTIIEWTPEIRDSLFSFMRFKERKIRMGVIRVLSASKEENLFQFFTQKIDSLKKEYLKAEGKPDRELLRWLFFYLTELGKIKNEEKNTLPPEYIKGSHSTIPG